MLERFGGDLQTFRWYHRYATLASKQNNFNNYKVHSTFMNRLNISDISRIQSIQEAFFKAVTEIKQHLQNCWSISSSRRMTNFLLPSAKVKTLTFCASKKLVAKQITTTPNLWRLTSSKTFFQFFKPRKFSQCSCFCSYWRLFYLWRRAWCVQLLIVGKPW